MGGAHHFLGDQAAAQLHCERGLALVVELGALNANFLGFDPRIRVLVYLARTLWLRGFSDQALRMVQKAIDEAASRDHPFPICLSLVHASTLFHQALRMVQTAVGEAASRDHPFPICVSLVYASMLLLWTGDLAGAGDLIEQLIVHAGRYSLQPYRAAGIALKGELAIARDEPEVGLDLLRSALETLRAQQYNLLIPGFIGALAEGLRKTGQFEEALFTINGAIARATNSGVGIGLVRTASD